MIARLFTTPRPVPSRRLPALAGTAVVLLALPVVLLAGWPLAGWGIAAVLWIAGELLELLLARLPLGLDNLAASGMVGIGMSFRAIAIMVVLIALAATAETALAVSAALTYIAAYTASFVVAISSYFGAAR